MSESFYFAVKLVDNRKVWCASKADTVDNPVAVIIHWTFYKTRTIYGCSAFWEQQFNKKRFCQKVVKGERKANDHNYNQCMQPNHNLQGSES